MRIPVPILAALLALAACAGAPEEPRATIENAVVTLPAIPGRPGAAYFTIWANRPARLVGLASPSVGRVELHQSMERGGMRAMGPLRDTSLSPGTPLVFEPGGRHAMLFDVAPAVRVGGTVALTFTFDPLPPVTVEAEVRGPGGGSHAAH